MAYKSGVTNTIYDFMEIINTFLTTELGDDNWVTDRIVRNVDNKITEAIWHGKGESLNDKIYIGMKVGLSAGEASGRLILAGYCGFDSELGFYDNVGSINFHQEEYETVPALPTLPLPNKTTFDYHLLANNRRLVIVTKLSTYYQSAYLGLTDAISVERQYPYPLLIAGSGRGLDEWFSLTNSPSIVSPFISSGNSTMLLRLPDGRWGGFGREISDKFQLFPYNCNQTSLLTIYKVGSGEFIEEDFMLYPIILQQKANGNLDAGGSMCQLDGVHFVSGTKDIGAEQVMVIDNQQYKCFDTGRRRDANSYFVVRMDD